MYIWRVTREVRWKTVGMPMRYGEHVMAAQGGMARAAPEQGRTSSNHDCCDNFGTAELGAHARSGGRPSPKLR